MTTAFELMFPEGSPGRALLADYANKPEDFNRFLASMPKEYRKLFSKPKVIQTGRPPVSDLTCMEMTGYYKPLANKKLSPFRFSIKLFTSDGAEFDLENPNWSAISYVTTPNRFKGWQTRNKPDVQTVEDMQTLFDAGFTHVAPLTNMVGGRTREPGNYFAASIDFKVMNEAIVILGDHALRIPQGSFIYREANGPFKNEEVFTRYRYSKLKARPNWASTEEWKTT